MFLEVPGRQHDEVIPKKYMNELEGIAMERRRKAYVNY
jgi:hypothetical protein